MNLTYITGRFTRDLNVQKSARADGSEYTVVRGTVAVDDGRDAKGERKTLYFPIVAWNKTGELLAKYAKKGDRIGLKGKSEPTSEKKEDGSYVEHYQLKVEEIEFLEPKATAPAEAVEVPAAPIEDDEFLY